MALEADLAASMQASMAEQQKMIDQMSTQEAQAKAAQRQAMRGQALQTEMQAQSIDPKAIRKGATAPGVAAGIATMAQPAVQLGVAGLAEQAKLQGTARAYESLRTSAKAAGAADPDAFAQNVIIANQYR